MKKTDIESIESPAGNVLDPSEYDVEERTGQVKFPGGASGQIIMDKVAVGRVFVFLSQP